MEGYLPHQNILKERYILAAAWKELNVSPKRVVSGKTLDGDDLPLCIALHDALSDADIAIAHNGDRFDFPFLETRCLFHGLPPLPPITKIDTLKLARKRFRFNSNRLDYLGQFLGVGGKQHVGNDVWLKALAGDQSALKTLAAYNKKDVLLLERVYKKLQPYVSNRLTYRTGCTRCKSRQLHYRGFVTKTMGIYQRYQCQKCGGWGQDPQAIKKFHTRGI